MDNKKVSVPYSSTSEALVWTGRQNKDFFEVLSDI